MDLSSLKHDPSPPSAMKYQNLDFASRINPTHRFRSENCRISKPLFPGGRFALTGWNEPAWIGPPVKRAKTAHVGKFGYVSSQELENATVGQAINSWEGQLVSLEVSERVSHDHVDADDNGQSVQNIRPATEERGDDPLSDHESSELIWRLINSDHISADFTKRSLHFIDEGHRFGPILSEMQSNANKWLAQEATDGEVARKFVWDDHQRDGIGMLVNLESEHNAALLADDMGLGKTATAAALTQINRLDAPTLVVAPARCISQWETEFMMLCNPKPGEIKLVKAKEDASFAALAGAKMVIVSYNHLVEEHKAMMAAYKDFTAARKDPSAKMRVNEACKVYSDKERDAIFLVTGKYPPEVTYIETSWERPNCPLFAMRWGRIILDEGHNIRNPRSATCIAVLTLRSQSRILLTGTPFNNEYTDLHPYFQFFGLQPFNDAAFFMEFFVNTRKKKNADTYGLAELKGLRSAILRLALQSVMIRRGKWDEFEGNPITDIPKCTFEDVVVELHNGSPDVDFPRMDIDFEAPMPDATTINSRFQLDSASTFFRWTRNRATTQELAESFIDHEDYSNWMPLLEEHTQYQSRSLWHPPYKLWLERTGKRDNIRKEQFSVGMAASLAASHWATPYAHYGFSEPMEDLGRYNEAERVELAVLEGKGITKEMQKARRQRFREWIKKHERWRSSKVDAIVKKTRECLVQGMGGIIIFSSYLCVLDVLDEALHQNNVECVRYDGSLTMSQRHKNLKTYSKSKTIRVILITMESGCEGVNGLQFKTRYVILAGCQWNLARESQAVSRAIRKGLEDEVQIFRFISPYSMDVKYYTACMTKLTKEEGLHKAEAYSGATSQGLEQGRKSAQMITEMRSWKREKFLTEMMKLKVENVKFGKGASMAIDERFMAEGMMVDDEAHLEEPIQF